MSNSRRTARELQVVPQQQSTQETKFKALQQETGLSIINDIIHIISKLNGEETQ
jgi:hypothetical protein